MSLLKVIIADDEPWIRTGLRRLIDWAALGCEVVGDAENGQDLLALAETVHPDILVTDVRMPGIDGLELIALMRERQPGCECLIVSGHEEFAYAQEAIRLGARDYLLKPVEEHDLADAIGRIVSMIAARTEAAMPATDEESRYSRLVQAAQQYLNEQYAHDPSLTEVAERLHVSPPYLSKLFKEETGENFVDYLTRVRINQAKRLLARKDARTNEVAEAVGYPNPEYFSQVFRRLTGLTPREYRQQFNQSYDKKSNT